VEQIKMLPAKIDLPQIDLIPQGELNDGTKVFFPYRSAISMMDVWFTHKDDWGNRMLWRYYFSEYRYVKMDNGAYSPIRMTNIVAPSEYIRGKIFE